MSTPETPKSPVAEGEIIAGKYKIEKILGVGGMGVVVAAMHVHLRQRVAIKFLLPDAAPEMITRFMREARASAKLKSEHIARVLDVAELPTGAPYMVMEYLEGGDLSRVLRKRGALPIEDAVDYLLQACEAIAEAHTVGIIHRDLKPANLFLTTAADGSATVKVLDFGISKDTSEQAGEDEMALTRTTAVLGSPYYMAPEQMRSTRTVDARADIWSIGIILYQLVTKAVPFKAGGFVELALMVINDEPPKPSELRPDLPPALEAAILRCIAKNPAERFASVAELAATIAPFGRASSIASAERIARTQGAPIPSIERPSSVSLVPPPPSAVSGSGSGSGPRSVGSALSSGPAIDLPSASVTPSLPGSAPQAPPPREAIPPPPAPAATGPQASVQQAQPSVAMGAPAPSPVVTGGLPYPPPAPFAASGSSSVAPGSLPPGSLTSTNTPSVPPASITGSSTGSKDAAHAATASTWTGAPVAPAPVRKSGARMVVAGLVLGAVAVAGTLMALKARTGPVTASQASTGAPVESPVEPPTAVPAPVITGEPRPTASPAHAPAQGSIEVTAGPVAPALGAPVSTTTTSPGARPGSKSGPIPAAVPPPAATLTPAPTAAPAAPPPTPVAPPPTATPAPTPKKKNVLDMDIQ